MRVLPLISKLVSLVSLLGTTNYQPSLCISSIPTPNTSFVLNVEIGTTLWCDSDVVFISMESTDHSPRYHQIVGHPHNLQWYTQGQTALVFSLNSSHYWVTLDNFWRFTLLFGYQIKLEHNEDWSTLGKNTYNQLHSCDNLRETFESLNNNSGKLAGQLTSRH